MPLHKSISYGRLLHPSMRPCSEALKRMDLTRPVLRPVIIPMSSAGIAPLALARYFAGRAVRWVVLFHRPVAYFTC